MEEIIYINYYIEDVMAKIKHTNYVALLPLWPLKKMLG